MEQLSRQRRSAQARRREGLTLIELMIAFGILAFGLLALLALQVEAMQSGQTGRHVSEAARIARDRMETFQRLDWDDAALQDTGGWAGPATVDRDVEMDGGNTITQQSYDVRWQIDDHPSDPTLRFIDVRVTWTEGAGQNPDSKEFVMSSILHDDPGF